MQDKVSPYFNWSGLIIIVTKCYLDNHRNWGPQESPWIIQTTKEFKMCPSFHRLFRKLRIKSLYPGRSWQRIQRLGKSDLQSCILLEVLQICVLCRKSPEKVNHRLACFVFDEYTFDLWFLESLIPDILIPLLSWMFCLNTERHNSFVFRLSVNWYPSWDWKACKCLQMLRPKFQGWVFVWDLSFLPA